MADFGHICMVLALASALAGSMPLFRPVLIYRESWRGMVQAAGRTAFALITLAFAALMASFVQDDFSVRLVFENSHTLQPLLYKISGVWGNHEGSLLLWLLVLSFCGVLTGVLMPAFSVEQRARMQTIMNVLTFIFLCLSIFTSNPFERLLPAPLDGQDLNPLLQDPGLAFHPPMLYIGYVGMALVFATACLVLWEGVFTTVHARALRLWTLCAWSILTAGLALGSWWAYYELGWGGWWFWDPVENAALMPWLVGAALLHSLRVAEVKQAMQRWCLLLSIIAFALSMLGTFLVRSGILTSVHSFASDPLRGMAILFIFAGITGSALTMLAIRWPQMVSQTFVKPISREGMLLLNNIFLSVAAATVLIGTLYPLFIQVLGRPEITVGPPYFNATFVPLMLPLFLVLALGQVLPWGASQNIRFIFIPTLVVVSGVAAAYVKLVHHINPLPLAGFAVGAAVVLGTSLGYRRMKVSQFVAHIGLGVCVMGIAGTGLGHEHLAEIQMGQRFNFAGYAIQYEGPFNNAGSNFISGGAVFNVAGIGDLMPSRRYFPVADKWTTEAAIYTTWLGDLFISTGVSDKNNAVSMRIRWQPLQVWIWLGAMLIMLGGLIGAVQILLQRRQT